MKTILISAALLFFSFLICVAEPSVNLIPGSYVLSFTAMSFTVAPTPEEKEITLPAQLKTEASSITIETRGSDGKPIKMSGRINGKEIYIWMTDVEDDRIVTYHLTGKVSDNRSAFGDASIFGSHQRAGGGKWTLTQAK